MSKKLVIIIIFIAAAVILVAAVAVWGKRYYEDRYVGEDYYAIVPLDYDMEPEPIYSMDGQEVGQGITYNLTAYNNQGEPKSVEFTVHDPESDGGRGEIPPLPGEYLWISASKQLVVRWKITDESDIPEKALEMIREAPR